MKSGLMTIGAVGLLSIAAPSIAAEHVINGGFETGDFTGWTESDPYGADPTYVAVDDFYPHSGSFDADLGTQINAQYGASPDQIMLSQTFASAAGQAYVVSFALSNSGGSDVPPTNLSNATVTFNGATLLDLINAPGSAYTVYGYDVTAAGASSSLNFSFGNTLGYWFLDDVSVTDVAPTTPGVPEPASWAMLVTGFGLVGSGIRRARKGVAVA